MTVAKEVSKYQLQLVGMQDVRLDRGGTKKTSIHLSVERGMGIMN
jgi:hypothetical protein